MAARAAVLPGVRLGARRTDAGLHELYREQVSAVYAFFSYSVPHHTAEDLTAATFERVIRAWSRYDPERAQPRTWIMAIARNVLTDHHRRQSHRRGVSLDEHPAVAATLVAAEDPIARWLSVDAARSWLAHLEPREREVLALRFGADMPAAEVARCLGLTEANVHQLGSRAMRRLRDRLPAEVLTDSA